MSTETISAPEAVNSESPAPVAVETDKSAAQDQTTPEAAKAADGGEDVEIPKKEPTEAEMRRKERNRERWQSMKAEREDALRRAAAAEAELNRIRGARPDFSQYEDPDDALAARTAHKLQEMSAGNIERTVQAERQRADQAVAEAWSAIKDDARERMPDFDAVVTDSTPIHVRAAPFIVESDKAAEIAYYLGKNTDIAKDLYREFETNPARALIKLGRIEADISKPQKAVSSAPKPAPVLSGSSSPPGFDVKNASVSDMQAQLRKAGILR